MQDEDKKISDDKTGELIFQRTIERLLKLPGYVQIGRTSDTGNRYITWYPYGHLPDECNKINVRFLLVGNCIEMDSNLMYMQIQ